MQKTSVAKMSALIDSVLDFAAAGSVAELC